MEFHKNNPQFVLFFKHCWDYKTTKLQLAGYEAHLEMRNVYHILVRKPAGKRTLVRRKRRRKYNIKMNFIKVGLGCGLDSCSLGN
jgi:hypothetical protein